jgi:hypothetical protein
MIFTKEWLNNCMPIEEVCHTHNSLKKMWPETISGVLFLDFGMRK